MTPLPRPLLAVLGLTVAAALYLALQPDPDQTAASAVPPRQRDGAVRTAPDRLEAAARSWPTAVPARDEASWRPVDAAVASAWGVPPAPVQPVLAPATPTAPEPPPLDYTLIGRIDDAGQQSALLMSPRRTHSVKVGDSLDGQWRVEALQDDGIDLIWLPGGVRQFLGYKKL